jgi:hypothetical protein
MSGAAGGPGLCPTGALGTLDAMAGAALTPALVVTTGALVRARIGITELP